MDNKKVPTPAPAKKEPLTEDDIKRILGRKMIDAQRQRKR